MKIPRGRRVLSVLVVVLAAAGAWVWSRSAAVAPLAPTGTPIRARLAGAVPPVPTAVLSVDTSHPENEFAPGAVGLSTEVLELGTGYLTAEHYRLVRLMRLLGPSVLRIGGSSEDFSWWTSSGEPPPSWATNTVTPADLSALHGLLVAAGWRVLLGVNLGHFEPARVADEARYAKKILGVDLLGIEIGNEPDGFSDQNAKVILRSSTYGVDEYLREAGAYHQALTAAMPGVAVDGPATSGIRWLTQTGAAAGMFTELTQHYYAINTCPKITPLVPQPTAAELLSPAVRQHENEFLETLVYAGRVTGRPTRIGETNSIGCSRYVDASPRFAGALWSLDWALRAVSSGVTALNFHGGFGGCGLNSDNQICAPSDEAARAGDVTAQPEYYGLLAARRLEGGRFVPTSLTAPHSLPNLTTWATITPGGTVRIAIDNFATAGLAQPVSIPSSGYAATYETLVGPSVEATIGITLGDAPVTSAGQWRPKPARPFHTRRSVRVIVRPASAVIVTLRPKRSRG